VAKAFRSGERRLAAVAEQYPRLVDEIQELGQIAGWAAANGLRLRVTFSMRDGHD
jgi:hypothetical protein